MPPLMMENGDYRMGPYHGMTLPMQSSPTRRSLVQVELSDKKRKQIVERKSLYERLEARRRVKFSIVKTALLNDTPVASQMIQEEKDFFWWSQQDLQTFESSAQKVVATIPRRIGKEEESYPSVLERVLDACQESNKGARVGQADLELLSGYHKSSLSKRGLEGRLLNVKAHNHSVRENLVYSIKVLRNNDKIDENAKLECIRACSERMTLPSRTFAKILGHVDTLALAPKPQSRRSSTFLLGKRRIAN